MRTRSHFPPRYLLFVLLLAAIPPSASATVRRQSTLTSGVQFASTARVKPGVYRLTDPGSGMVQVTGSGFTVDLRGAKIVGPGQNKGTGIHITGARGVTIRGANVTGCLWGIVLERCRGVKLIDCVSSHNGDLQPGTVIDESGHEPEDQHGGGILLRDCEGCSVVRCTVQHQWDGIDVVRSNGNTIEDGDFSFSGNWGVHFWSSSKNVFRRNRAIWCTTGEGTLYQALTGWQTYDAQAVGIDHASCDNLIEENDLRFGGDGIFIRANEGPQVPGGPTVPPLHSSDRNILRGNDCSFSPNNAIEADLIAGTVIEDNNCSNSHYGLWLGYSRGTVVRRNTCLNDTAHAIEIENGQSITIDNNLFGFDEPRADVPLVYLRQNGRDRIPSGPYTIRANHFYGTARCVLLRGTTAALADNTVAWDRSPVAKLVVEETPSRATESGTRLNPGLTTVTHTPRIPARIVPGSLVRIDGQAPDSVPTAVELNGIPVWVRRESRGSLAFWMPTDFWDRPAPLRLALRIYDGGWTNEAKVTLDWPRKMARVTGVKPNPARIGDTIAVEGVNLPGDLSLNGRPITAERSGPGRIAFRTPPGILATTHFNLIVGDTSRGPFTWPVTFAVDVPVASQPHILSATFSPTTLKVGDVLTVTFVVRNNLPAPAMLVTKPPSGFTYDEKQAGWEIGAEEPPGTLHLRVTSDHPGEHEPGAWPWFFGFDRPELKPGETVTVIGRIRVETPGEHEFRVGLVASGFRFIDDNAFRTKITVLPK